MSKSTGNLNVAGYWSCRIVDPFSVWMEKKHLNPALVLLASVLCVLVVFVTAVLVFTVRHCASSVLAVIACPSVCQQVIVVQRWLNLGSH